MHRWDLNFADYDLSLDRIHSQPSRYLYEMIRLVEPGNRVNASLHIS